MKPSIYRISLDVHDAHSGVCLDMKQRDTARQIDITLTDAGFPYQISEECYAVFAATKADGKRIRHNCNIRNNIIQYIVRTQTTAAVGPMECEIKLYGAGDKLLMSPGFSILVSENAVTNDEELESEDEVDDLTKLISEATTVITEGKNINSRSEKLIEEMETEKETLEDKAAEAKGAAENAQSMAESARKSASDAEKAAHLAQKYSTRPDLSQNNPDEPGYIKNRTHWVESSETVIAWDGNVMGTRTYTDALGKIYYKISDKCPEESDVVGATIEFSDGKILTVSTKMFNGYTEGHAAVGGYIYLRKTPVVYPGNVFDPHDVGVYAAIINDVYPAVFRYGKNVVHTLDEKFVPNTIARKIELQQAVGEKLNKSGFNPNKYLCTDTAGNVVETEFPDSGQNVDLTGYAKTEDIPTKVSQLTNDSNYLTEHQDLSEYAKKAEIPAVPVQSVNGKTGAVALTAEDVGALPDTYTPPDQTAEQVGADPVGTAASKVSEHNTDTASHNDLRLELKALSDRLTAFFDSDDTTLDELSEIVAYITNNKTLIESITSSKVNVSDIIDNLTTNAANKPLSAAQGVVLKGLIDTVSNSLSGYQPKGDYALVSQIPTVPTKVSTFSNDAGYLTQHQDISGKLDRNQGTANAGKILVVGTDGNLVLTEMPTGSTGDVSGVLDDSNNILLTGALADGTYTLKYEMEDGSVVDVGTLEVGEILTVTAISATKTKTSYTVGDTLATDDITVTVTYSDGSTAEVTDYTVDSSAVQMGTAGSYNIVVSYGGKTADIAITVEEYQVINLAEPNATNTTDISIWCNDARLGSDYGYRSSSGNVVTNYIPCTGGMLYVKGMSISLTSSQLTNGIAFYDASKTGVYMGSLSNMIGDTASAYDHLIVSQDENGVYIFDFSDFTLDSFAYVRLVGSLTGTVDDVIITVDQPIE